MPVGVQVNPVIEHVFSQRDHLRAAAVIRRHRLAGTTIAHQLQDGKQADRSDFTHRRMRFAQVG